MPYGMVIVMEVYAARLDDDGKSEVGEDGKFLKSRKLHTWVMKSARGGDRRSWRNTSRRAICRRLRSSEFHARHVKPLDGAAIAPQLSICLMRGGRVRSRRSRAHSCAGGVTWHPDPTSGSTRRYLGLAPEATFSYCKRSSSGYHITSIRDYVA